MLENILKNKQGFKLVCGAGNEDIKEVEKLVTIYALAGCKFIDICAKNEILDIAKKALKKIKKENEVAICVSVGIAGDPHISKAKINNEKCINCKKCINICPHNAIENKKNVKINKKRCLGCTQCINECSKNAIEMTTEIKDYKEFLPELIEKGISCIEFHAISEDEKNVEEKWIEINELFDGLLCISLDRSELGDKKLIKRVKKLIEKREPYTTIIQADGVAMSGNNDELGTTLQAVATAQLFQNAKLPVYIMMSGGTNTKSTELAKNCGVLPHCLAVGSYARKIVKDYLLMDDLLQNEKSLNEAVKIAKELIDISLENMRND